LNNLWRLFAFGGFFCLTALTIAGQVPQLINYQAIARNTATGIELIDQDIFLIATIRAQGPGGTAVYEEQHPNVQTNGFGLFNIQIGGGEPTTGSMEAIDWAAITYWLEIELDIGQGLQSLGSMQLLSVPYALHAGTVSNADDADADPNNERITAVGIDNNTLTVTEAGVNFDVDLSPLIDDADADPTNEKINSVTFDPDQFLLSINEGGEAFEVDFSGLIGDADSDPTNELITGVQLIGTSLVISENQNWSVSLDQLIDDADADPTNELIAENGLTLVNDSILTISEGGISHSVNLGPLSRDVDWVKPENENVVYNTTDRIGIGTSIPVADLDVRGSMAVNTVLVNNLGVSNYTIAGDDSNIVCRIIPGGSFTFTFVFPLAATCQGRMINIFKRGSVEPFLCGFIFNVNGDQINYNASNNNPIASFSAADYKFISLGADGWLRLQ